MKLVLDTNTIISGSLWNGTPAKLLSSLNHGAAVLCISETLLSELEDVLGRKHLKDRIESRNEPAESIVNRLRNASKIVSPKSIALPANLRDADDVHVLECAIAAEADLIVSGDKDLLVMGNYEGIPIVNAADAVKRLGLY